MKQWYDTLHCTSRTACRLCRTRPEFRAWVAQTFAGVPGADFECECGVTASTLPPPTRTAKQPAAFVRARLGICDECGDADCKMHNITPCERRAIVSRQHQACPCGQW